MDSQTDPLWNNSHILFLGVMTLKNITGTSTITFFNVYDVQTALLEIIFLGQPTALRNHHETWYQMSDRKEIVAITQLGFNNWISTYWPTNGRVGRVEFVTLDKSWVELKTMVPLANELHRQVPEVKWHTPQYFPWFRKRTPWLPLYYCLGGQMCSNHLRLGCSSPITCFHLSIYPQNTPRMWYRRGWGESVWWISSSRPIAFSMRLV